MAACEDAEEAAAREKWDPLQRDLCGGVDPLVLANGGGDTPSAAGGGDDDVRAILSLAPSQMADLRDAAARLEGDGDHARGAACSMRVVASELALARTQADLAAAADREDARRAAAALAARAVSACATLGAAHAAAGRRDLAARCWALGLDDDRTGELALQLGLLDDGRDRPARARDRFRRAAELGCGDAMVELGLLHVHGRGGPRDLAKAARCLRRARRAANVGESRLDALDALETAVAAALEDGPPRSAAAPEPTPAPESGHDEGAAPAPLDQ